VPSGGEQVAEAVLSDGESAGRASCGSCSTAKPPECSQGVP